MDIIYQWMDVIWLPLALFIATKDQRGWVIAFFLSSMMMMRLQVEMMREIGFDNGIAGFMTSDVFDRGMVVYSIFYILYLVLVHFSPNTTGPVFMAATISVFFMAFFSSVIIMLL